jgi:hypothetical protein
MILTPTDVIIAKSTNRKVKVFFSEPNSRPLAGGLVLMPITEPRSYCPSIGFAISVQRRRARGEFVAQDISSRAR